MNPYLVLPDTSMVGNQGKPSVKPRGKDLWLPEYFHKGAQILLALSFQLRRCVAAWSGAKRTSECWCARSCAALPPSPAGLRRLPSLRRPEIPKLSAGGGGGLCKGPSVRCRVSRAGPKKGGTLENKMGWTFPFGNLAGSLGCASPSCCGKHQSPGR